MNPFYILFVAGTDICEASETFVNVIVLNGTNTPKACFNNYPTRMIEHSNSSSLPNLVRIHLGNQQAIATLDIGLYHVMYLQSM